MDRRERNEDPQTALLVAMQGMQADLWTALPGIIQSFDPVEMTCEVQPTIEARLSNPDGTFEWIKLPKLVDCPVIFPSGGGCTLTFPLALGDECLVIFASRCIDAWWQNGGIQNQALFRMHDLSDGFVLPGPKSLPRTIPSISTSAVQLRSDDGQAVIEINPTTHNVEVTTSADVTINAVGNVAVTTGGNASVTAAGTANVTAPAINLGAAGQSLLALVTSAFSSLFNSHTHPGDSGGTTGAPNQTMDTTHLTSTIKGG